MPKTSQENPKATLGEPGNPNCASRQCAVRLLGSWNRLTRVAAAGDVHREREEQHPIICACASGAAALTVSRVLGHLKDMAIKCFFMHI